MMPALAVEHNGNKFVVSTVVYSTSHLARLDSSLCLISLYVQSIDKCNKQHTVYLWSDSLALVVSAAVVDDRL